MYEVLPVIPKQTDFVTEAMAETKTMGSSCAQLEPDLNCSGICPGNVSSTPYTSAKKMPEILPFSASLASQV